jgi:hypothetical protein
MLNFITSWVEKRRGGYPLKMITDKYFSWIPDMTHQDGSKSLEESWGKVNDDILIAGMSVKF